MKRPLLFLLNWRACLLRLERNIRLLSHDGLVGKNNISSYRKDHFEEEMKCRKLAIMKLSTLLPSTSEAGFSASS